MGLKVPDKGFKRKCPECRGKGFIEHSSLNWANFSVETWTSRCPRCQGKGKVE